MARRIPSNLELLHAAFDPKRIGDILPGDEFEFDGVQFVSAYLPESTPDRFFIVKTPELIGRYLELCERFRGGRIVELGIAEGGSTALIALAADPERLVAIDLDDEPLEPLSVLIEARGLGERVRPCWGIDQGDREQLGSLMDQEFAGQDIDLVIDDCSHQLDPTRTSFEVLFPRLRPDGLYVIEDWNADHLMRGAVIAALRDELAAGNTELQASIRAGMAAETEQGAAERRAPLSQLAIEFVLARAISGDAIAEVVVDEFWITVRRGPGQLDPATFRLDDTYTDFFGLKGW